jgi:hypothetical protein
MGESSGVFSEVSPNINYKFDKHKLKNIKYYIYVYI